MLMQLIFFVKKNIAITSNFAYRNVRIKCFCLNFLILNNKINVFFYEV